MPITYPNPAQPISRHKQKMNHLNPNAFTSGGSFQASSSSTTSNPPSSSSNIIEPSSSLTTGNSSKMWEETENDELMAVLGYKVKSSDMPQVAKKLEQLEQAMYISNQYGLSEIVSDSIYNPSDLSTYLESMIYEFNPSNNIIPNQETITYSSSSSVVVFDDSTFDSDLTAIPGKAIYPPTPPSPPRNKRLKTSWEFSCSGASNNNIHESTTLGRPVVMVESEENGVRLVHALMACAEAVQTENYKLAEALVKQIGLLAVSQAGSMRKVATYFADALARRIYKLYPCNQNNYGFSDYLQMHFYEACPYLKFAHFTANQAILEAFAGKSCVHVIDFGIKQGMQWPALLQALALRPGGSPSFRLTGIGPPSSDNSDYLQEVGWKLAQLADTIDIKFEYRGYVASSLADLDASMFDVREGETVAVNSIFELHPMLARPGAIDKVLSVVRGLKPCIFTVVEQEANHNGAHFLDRFTEALHYYSTLFDSVEGGGRGVGAGGECEVGIVGGGGGVTEQDKVMTEVYLGRQICNVLACEGVDRVERHETLAQWRTRFDSAEFEPVHLGSNAFKQASMLLALFNGDGYRVEENNGCLLLGWHTRPLISTSAWKLK